MNENLNSEQPGDRPISESHTDNIAPLAGKSGISTRAVEPPQNLWHSPRWGDSSVDRETHICLHVVGSGKPIHLRLTHEAVIGRSDVVNGIVPDITLDEYDAIQFGVSRRHAMLTFEDGLIKVMDLDSANSTYLNGHRLLPYQPRILRDGDELRLGKLILRVAFAKPAE